MSELLDALIKQRRKKALAYQEYLQKIIELTRKAKNPETGSTYPKAVNSPGQRALYDNLNKNEALALSVDKAVRMSRGEATRSKQNWYGMRSKPCSRTTKPRLIGFLSW